MSDLLSALFMRYAFLPCPINNLPWVCQASPVAAYLCTDTRVPRTSKYHKGMFIIMIRRRWFIFYLYRRLIIMVTATEASSSFKIRVLFVQCVDVTRGNLIDLLVGLQSYVYP